MKKCAIISNYVVNNYRKELLTSHINYFKSKNIDVLLVSSQHMEKYDGVDNYITINYKSEKFFINYAHPVSYVPGRVFYRSVSNSALNYRNYFIKMYQTVFNYCNGLEYEFVYFIDFDLIFNENYINSITGDLIDNTKLYLYYQPNSYDEYSCMFFFGNIKELCNGLSQSNIDSLEELQSKMLVRSNENALFKLFSENKNCIVSEMNIKSMFNKFNMFSSRNTADVYYDIDLKQYIFLFMKGDTMENEFSCEVLTNDVVIFSRHSNITGIFQWFCLDFDKTYTIKCYDGIISENTLYTHKNIYTDKHNVSILNYSKSI